VPVEKDGAQATKCGWICRDTYAEAESELVIYLDNLRAEADTDYTTYVDAEQSAIGNEGVANDGWEDWGLGYNVWVLKPFTSIHTINEPNVSWSTPYPT
jgi:hypothetical protein